MGKRLGEKLINYIDKEFDGDITSSDLIEYITYMKDKEFLKIINK